MAIRSDDADALLRDAVSLLQQNLPAEAESRCRAALAHDADNESALSLLGTTLHAQARYGDAEALFLDLAARSPAEPAHWINVGTMQRCAGRPDEAITAYSQAAFLGAASADFFYNVGLAHIERGDYEAGLGVLARAMGMAPDDAEIRYRYAICCYERLRTDEALAALAAIDLEGELDAELIANIGLLLMKLGETERAERAVRRAAGNGHDSPFISLTLAQVLERTNRIAESRAILDRLLQRPDSALLGGELTLLQAQLDQREQRHDSAVRLLSQLTENCQKPERRHFFQFPLAKSLDALGQHDAAFDALLAAHASQAQFLRLTAPLATIRGAPTIAIARFGCDPADVAAWTDSCAPSTGESPIFIVAFPRSGTTLLELALDAHPMLKSMDEQPFVQNALEDFVAGGIAYPTELGRLTDTQLESARAKYWARARRKAALAPGHRLIDKNPLNILRLPVMRRLFPNARILLAIRHPCDVIMSCFMQHFRTPDFALLCGDLTTLAIGFRRSFDFWYQQHELLSPASREIRYETFVIEFERELRAITQFLELPWSDQVLEPGANARSKRYISTPSYSQVIQPVNSQSIGKWKRYASRFSEVIPTLQSYLARWNYEV